MAILQLFSRILLIFLLLSCAAAAFPRLCQYKVVVKTGSAPNAGTDATVSVTFSDKNGDKFLIHNLEVWSPVTSIGHDSFESGNTDTFTGIGRCTGSPICKVSVRSYYGRGRNTDWLCDWIQVSSLDVDRLVGNTQTFEIGQWISPNGEAVEKDLCEKDK